MTYAIEDFLNIRWATPLGFTQDASTVLVGSNLSGTVQLYTVERTGGELVQITDDDEPVTGRLLPATDRIVLSKDTGGNERAQLYLMDLDGTNRRVIVEEPDFLHVYGGATRDGGTIAYTTNRRNGVDFDVIVHDLATGDERAVYQEGGWCSAPGFSPDGRFLAVQRLTERTGDNDQYLVDLTTGEVIEVLPHEDAAHVGAPAWLPDSSAFFFATDSEREFHEIARFDLRSRTVETVLAEEWDLGCSMDHAGSALLVTANADGWTRMRRYDPVTLEPLGDVPLPADGIVGGLARSRDGRFTVVGFEGPTGPPDVYVIDHASDAIERLTVSPNPVPAEVFVDPETHRFPSFDGEPIPVFLYRPRDAEGDTPVVAWIHGGPEAQYRPIFNPVIQYLVSRGYAVAAPNVRGSTGYGKRFHHLDDVEKRLDSVADLAALQDWLATQDGIDAERAALFGGSYGGYMVLAGLAFQPDRWAAGVDIVGISSLVTFLENTAVWRRKYREREYGSLEHDREFLEAASPINRVDDIRAPLFIIHGANDPRVPLSEAEQIHRVLTDKGVPCELAVYEDEGHGLAKLKNRLDAYPRAADFLDGVLRA